MIKTFNIQEINIKNDLLSLIVDGVVYKVSLESISQKLLVANEIERNLFKISPSGYGIHWPLIDEDLSIAHIIKQGKEIKQVFLRIRI